MSASRTSSQAGITTVGLLGVAFIVLKLIGAISWSWWWVTLPFWGPSALMLVVLIIIVAIALIQTIRSPRKTYRNRSTK